MTKKSWVLLTVAVIVFALFIVVEHQVREVFMNGTYRERAALFKQVVSVIGPSLTQQYMETYPNVPQLHMMNHIVGAHLYLTSGAEGILRCSPVLSYSCFHGFVTEYLLSTGLARISEVTAHCDQLEVMEHRLQCFHGIGHGLLEAVGYEALPGALAACNAALKDTLSQDRCKYGVFMENIFGPFGVPPANRWYKADDPLYPCHEPSIVNEHGTYACLQTQLRGLLIPSRYPGIGGDPVRASQFCDTLADSDKEICRWSLGWSIFPRKEPDVDKAISICNTLYGWEAECRWMVYQNAYYFDYPGLNLNTVCEAESDSRKEDCLQAVVYGSIARKYPDEHQREVSCKRLLWNREACVAYMRARPSVYESPQEISLDGVLDEDPVDRTQTFYPF